MKRLSVAATVAILTACSSPDDEQTGTDQQSQLKQEAQEWVQQTKELGSAAMDSAKQTAAQAGETSKEYYEAAKEGTKAAYAGAKEKTQEYYDAATGTASASTGPGAEQGSELMQQAGETGTTTLGTGQADIAIQQGQPPTLEQSGLASQGAASAVEGTPQLEEQEAASMETGKTDVQALQELAPPAAGQ